MCNLAAPAGGSKPDAKRDRADSAGRAGKSDTPGPEPTAAPTFGQHGDEVLAEHGFTPTQIAALRERGIVR